MQNHSNALLLASSNSTKESIQFQANSKSNILPQTPNYDDSNLPTVSATEAVSETDKSTSTPIKSMKKSTPSSSTSMSVKHDINIKSENANNTDISSVASTKKDRKGTKYSKCALSVSALTLPPSETKMNRTFLENYLSSILLTEDHLVIRTLLKSVRSSLCCANGDVIVDDMIAFGYLQVNTGNLKYILLLLITLITSVIFHVIFLF